MGSFRHIWCLLLSTLSIVCFFLAVAVPPAEACGSIRDWIRAYQEATSDTSRVNALMDISNACGDYDTRRDDTVLVEILSDGLTRGLPKEPVQRVFDTYHCLPSQASSEPYGKLGSLDQAKCPKPEELGDWRVVKDDRARLRNGANAEAAVIGHFMRGNIVVSSGETGEWIAVKGWNGAEGYMHGSLLEPYLSGEQSETETSHQIVVADPKPPSVFAVATEGLNGLVDAAFGQAQALAAEAAAQSGDKAFVVESMSGTASIDLKDRRLVYRLRLLPDIPSNLLEQRTNNAPETGIEAAIEKAIPPQEDRIAAEPIMDAMFKFHVPAFVGRPSDGGVPPQIYAVSESGEMPALGEGDVHAQWIPGFGRDIEAMLADALQRGADTYSQGHMEVAFRLAAWAYTQGGIGGINDKHIVLEVRGIPPTESGTKPLTGSVEEMVETLRVQIKAHDWPQLARHYQQNEKVADRAELLSGAFFHPLFPPVDGADAGGLWRYRHPFHPEAKLMGVLASDDPDIQNVTMMLEIDQGTGTPQRVLQSFRLRKVDGGFLVLPD